MSEEDSKKGFLKGFNLLTAFGGRAGDALSRLVGVPINAVAARLERGEANIVARTEGQVAFQKIVASAAAQEAIKNPEFMQRAIETFGRDLVEKQINKDKIASKAVLILEDEYVAEDTHGDTQNLKFVSPDWLNYFSSHAEKVSTEDMQDLWAKILAGEIRKPGQFSLSTMRVLSETDSELAKLFTKKINHSLNGVFLHKRPTNGALDMGLISLENAGFIKGSDGLGYVNNFTQKYNGGFPLFYKSHMIKVNCEDSCKKLSLPTLHLTKAGQDIINLVDTISAVELAQKILAIGIKEINHVEVFLAVEVTKDQWRPTQLIQRFGST